MNCRSAESLFSALLEDELNQRERRSLEAHLMGCRRCSVGLRELRASLQLLHTLPLEGETSAHFEEDVMARIRSGEGLRPSMVEWIRALWTPARIRPLAWSGALASLIALALVLFRPGPGFFPHFPGKGSMTVEHVVKAAEPTPSTEASGSVTPTQTLASAPSAPAGSGVSAGAPLAVSRTRSVPGGGAPGNAPMPSDAATSGSWPAGLASVPSESAPGADGEASSIPNPDSRYIDEYITDQFYLDRGLGGSGNPSITPVSGRSSDDVYIIF